METNKEDVNWPSTRVAKGGIFNLPKVQYSKETHDFLYLLMEEQKLSIMQRNKINYILRSGQSLPVSKPIAKTANNTFPGFDKMRVKNARRRTLDAIKASGGYDRTKFIPTHYEPSELKKVRLQEKMSGLKHEFSIENEPNLRGVMSPSKDDDGEIDPVDELLHEIQERMDWLEEMEKLGEGHIYKPLIKNEIEERLRLIKRLQPDANRKTTESNGEQ
ncbi:UPF0193 protein EVG1 homolog [Sitodiplosis mosellana]|uniref:UPF0193 protein EVG1 homolog n=1 Tax=Sitodiplosis mosellana TaxID=263140 RepID=UPI0024445EAD|nr:UPF0193 protein EVG1 homolog [Sitodiplosis mosellana]